jgi:hypothetical protein
MDRASAEDNSLAVAALHIPGFIPSAKRFHSMSFAQKGSRTAGIVFQKKNCVAIMQTFVQVQIAPYRLLRAIVPKES